MRGVGGRRADSAARHRRWGWRSAASRYAWTRAALASGVAGAAARAVADATRSGASAHGGAAADGLPPAVRVAAVPWRRGWRSHGGGKAGAATAGAERVRPAGGGGRVPGDNGRGQRRRSLPAAAEI